MHKIEDLEVSLAAAKRVLARLLPWNGWMPTTQYEIKVRRAENRISRLITTLERHG